MATLYFDPAPKLWVSSAGLSVLIGIALNLAARLSATPRDAWIIFRVVLIPFCVSSYSALIEDRGFILIFPPSFRELAVGLTACAFVICLHLVCRLIETARPSVRL